MGIRIGGVGVEGALAVSVFTRANTKTALCDVAERIVSSTAASWHKSDEGTVVFCGVRQTLELFQIYQY